MKYIQASFKGRRYLFFKVDGPEEFDAASVAELHGGDGVFLPFYAKAENNSLIFDIDALTALDALSPEALRSLRASEQTARALEAAERRAGAGRCVMLKPDCAFVDGAGALRLIELPFRLGPQGDLAALRERLIPEIAEADLFGIFEDAPETEAASIFENAASPEPLPEPEPQPEPPAPEAPALFEENPGDVSGGNDFDHFFGANAEGPRKKRRFEKAAPEPEPPADIFKGISSGGDDAPAAEGKAGKKPQKRGRREDKKTTNEHRSEARKKDPPRKGGLFGFLGGGSKRGSSFERTFNDDDGGELETESADQVLYLSPKKRRTSAAMLVERANAVTIGRKNTDIVIRKDFVSENHAVIQYDHGRYYLRDDDSTNGTYLNGERLKRGASREITPGSEISFGGALFYAVMVDQ